MSEISISDKLAETYLVSQKKLKHKKMLLWCVFILTLIGLSFTSFISYYTFNTDVVRLQEEKLRIIRQLPQIELDIQPRADHTIGAKTIMKTVADALEQLDNSIINNFLFRIPLLFPFFWIAWFCQRSISQIDKLSEEYRHKESAMRTYEGFMQQIQVLHKAHTSNGKKANRDNWINELEKDLMNVLLNVIEKNPSDTLGKPITPIEQVVEILESWKKDRVPKEKSKTLKRKSKTLKRKSKISKSK